MGGHTVKMARPLCQLFESLGLSSVETFIASGNVSASTFSNAVLERTIRGRATLRGVNTVKAIAAKYPLGGR